MMNRVRFIRATPAGKAMKVLIAGSSLLTKTISSPYLANHRSARSRLKRYETGGQVGKCRCQKRRNWFTSKLDNLDSKRKMSNSFRTLYQELSLCRINTRSCEITKVVKSIDDRVNPFTNHNKNRRPFEIARRFFCATLCRFYSFFLQYVFISQCVH